MEEAHKTVLRQNRRPLVNDLANVEKVVDHLLQHDILTDGMAQDILEGEATKINKARKLMDILPKRGPRAFHIFCKVLVDTSNSFLAGLLDPSLVNASPSPAHPVSVSKPVSGPTFHPSSYPAASQSSKPSTYPTSYQPSGEEQYKPTIDQKGSMPLSPVKGHDKPGFEGNAQKYGEEKHKVSRQPSIPCQPAGEEEDDIQIPGNWTETLTTGAVSLPSVRPCDMDDKQIFTQQNAQMAYLMGRKPRGRVLIINNKSFTDKKLPTRPHSDDDCNRLVKLFKKLDFKVLGAKSNASEKDIWEYLKREAEETDHSNFDCFVAVFLSHGHQGEVYCADGGTIQIQDIVELFSRENSHLEGKPKLFLFQAADLHKSDCGAGLNKSDSASSDLPNLGMLQIQGQDVTDAPFPIQLDIPVKSDIFVAMATTAKFRENMGSWFIQAFAYVLSQLAFKKHLLAMMKEVNKIVNLNTTDRDLSELDVCVWKHSLMKKLYFFPGYKQPLHRQASEDQGSLPSLPTPNFGGTEPV